MIQPTVYNILGLAILSIMFAHWYQPIQNVKNRCINLLSFFPLLHRNVFQAMNCAKCVSFIASVIVFQNIFIAAVVAYVGFLLSFIIDKVNAWYE